MNNIHTGALVTLTAQAAGTVSSAAQINPGRRGLVLTIDVTAITGTGPSLTVSVKGFDRTSGKWFTLLSSAALSAVGTTVLTVYPGVAAAANTAANIPLPFDWRVDAVVAGTTPAVTATVAASVIL